MDTGLTKVQEQIQVIARPNPLREETYIAAVAPGLTITEILGGDLPGLRVWIGDVEVPKEQWRYIRPKLGNQVIVKAVPSGGRGDKQTLRLVAAIVVGVVAGALGQKYGYAFAAEYATTGGIVEGIATGVIALGVTAVGGLLINALIPLPGQPSSDESDGERVGALTGVSNRPNPFGVIPKVYGTMRYFPPLPMTATPYTVAFGSYVRLYALYVLGYGPLRFGDAPPGAYHFTVGRVGDDHVIGPDKVISEKIRIGETPLSSFGEPGEDFDYRIARSVSPQAYSLYKGTVIEEQINHDMKAIWEEGDLGPPLGWITHVDKRQAIRSTEPNTTRIGITIAFPNGLWSANDKHPLLEARVEFRVEYRTGGTNPGAWTLWRLWEIRGPNRNSSYHGITLDVPTNVDGYDVRVSRERTYVVGYYPFTDAVWTSMRSSQEGRPFHVNNCVILELMVKSSANVTGVLQRLSIEATSVLPTWDGATWGEAATSNPAWVYCDLLKGLAASRPISDSELDLPAVKSWADNVDESPWGYNIVLDTAAPLISRLREVCVNGRAAFGIRDGKFTVVQDTPQTVPVQVVTPRNSWNFQGQRVFPDVPHALRVPYYHIDDLAQYERIVYDDGYNATNATRIEVLEFPGVTSKELAWILGRYYLANTILRPETYVFNMDVENVVCTRGDMVEIMEDTILVGLHAGRITEITGDPTNTGFVSDEEILYEAGGPLYGVQVRKQDNTVHTGGVVNLGSPSHTVTLNTSTTGLSVGDLFIFGEITQEAIEAKIVGITYANDLVATITAVPAAPTILDSDTQEIPDWDPQITEPVNYANIAPRAPIIISVESDEKVLLVNADGTLTVRVRVSYIAVVGQPGTWVHAYFLDNASGEQIKVTVPGESGEVLLNNVIEGTNYRIWLQAEGATGLLSALSTTWQHTVIGKTTAPPDVDVFKVIRLPDGTREATWILRDPPLDLAGYVIRYSQSTSVWEAMTALHDGLLLSSPYEFSRPVTAGSYIFAIKAVDTSGNESQNANVFSTELGLGPLRGILELFDFHALGWPGIKSSCWVDPATGDLIPNSSRTWAELPAWSAAGTWIGPVVPSYSYQHPIVNLGASFTFTPLVISLQADGDAVIEERHSDTGLSNSYSDWAPTGSLVTGQYIELRLTVTTT